MTKKLQRTVQSLIDTVKEYESDTFSASGSRITQKEAENVVADIIAMASNRIDGVQIASYLEDERE